MKTLSKWIDQIYRIYHRYRNILKIIDSKVSTKIVIKSVLFSLLITLLIVLIPVLISINLFIYNKLELVLSFVLLFFLTSWGFMFFHFYYTLLKSYEPELEHVNVKLPKLIEGISVSFFLFILGIVIISVIF